MTPEQMAAKLGGTLEFNGDIWVPLPEGWAVLIDQDEQPDTWRVGLMPPDAIEAAETTTDLPTTEVPRFVEKIKEHHES